MIDFSREKKLNELFILLKTLLLLKTKEHKTILFTSPYPGEGKSFLALNFAQIFTHNRKKVLFMTVYPQFTRRIKSAREILKSEGGIRSNIQKIQFENKISFYTLMISSTDKNGSSSLESKEFRYLFEKLKSVFDYIIIDGAEYPMSSDSLMLSSYVDVAISVIRLGYTPVKVSKKHFSDMEKYSKKHFVLVNYDKIDLDASGYPLVSERSPRYYWKKFKLRVAKV